MWYVVDENNVVVSRAYWTREAAEAAREQFAATDMALLNGWQYRVVHGKA